jgi:hypothetical protein
VANEIRAAVRSLSESAGFLLVSWFFAGGTSMLLQGFSAPAKTERPAHGWE